MRGLVVSKVREVMRVAVGSQDREVMRGWGDAKDSEVMRVWVGSQDRKVMRGWADDKDRENNQSVCIKQNCYVCSVQGSVMVLTG